MKYFLPLAGASLCPPPGQFSEVKACQAFQDAETRQNRTYNSTGDRDKAYVNFLENLHEMEDVEKKFQGAKFSMDGPYFDWSIVQWKARNNLKYKDYKVDHSKIIHEDSLKKIEDPTVDFSWRAQGGVNAVKDQGQCGSCWAFSSIANIEGVHFHESGTLYSLSESELVDCMDSDHGCNGGLPSYTDNELKEKNMGLELESAYSYKPQDRQCAYDASKGKVVVVQFGVLEQGREDMMQQVLVTYGPLSVGVNADPLMWYSGGIINPDSPDDCDPQGIDHAVTVTGYGHDDDVNWWEVRNSWGPSWGMEGYFHLVRGKNACGISYLVSTVTKTADAAQKPKEFIA
jgi:cathepsin F